MLRAIKHQIKNLFINGETLIYVHIGKCGGESLWQVIQSSSITKEKFRRIHRVHVKKPPLFKNASYLIVVRNPIERAISAFNWRYKLVVEGVGQSERFENEHAVLSRYKSLNVLAEALYDENGVLNESVAKDFRSIHHLKEDIAFYLADLVPHLRKDQLFAVMTTENLDHDMETYLDVKAKQRAHSNRGSVASDKLEISTRARGNLRQFLADDYSVLENLFNLSGIKGDQRERLLE